MECDWIQNWVSKIMLINFVDILKSYIDTKCKLKFARKKIIKWLKRQFYLKISDVPILQNIKEFLKKNFTFSYSTQKPK